MNISVVLDRLTPYSPGDTVSGRVLFVKTTEPSLAKPQGLKIHFKGKSTVRFTVTDFHVKGRAGYWKTHTTSEIYFNSSKYLVGNGTYEVEDLVTPGLKEYPFSYRLPTELPSSYKGTHGSVDYTITITLKRSWGINKEVTQYFNVNAEVDIGHQNNNLRHQLQNELMVRKSSRIGMLWWGGTLFVNFKLKKKSYVPGESVNFSAQIINDSNSKIHKAKLLLTQECRYFAQGKSHTVTHIIKKVKGPAVNSGESTVMWENNSLLKIPPLPPTNLGGLCRIIQVNYFVILIVQPSSLTLTDKTVTCKLPLTLGTKRGTGNRQSYPNPTTSSTGSLQFGTNRVGSIFGSRQGTMERSMDSQASYYQNVVFPLARCFSAPVYENYRFSTNQGLNEGFQEEEEEEQGRYEPPPTYEEAMTMTGRLSTHPSENNREVNHEDVYQNSGVVAVTNRINNNLSPVSPSLSQPIYNNS